MARKQKCVCCDNKFNPDDLYPTYDGDRICESCESDDRCEPIAWINGINDTDDCEAERIGRYFNETDGTFWVSYVSTDAWRGHYNAHSDQYTEVHSDCALSYSQDEAESKKL